MKATSIRFEDEVYEELVYLADLLNISRNTLVNNLVRTEYNKFKSDPVLLKKTERLMELKSMLEDFQKKVESDGIA